jgi:capsular exopolysaccharide synthesis family protein
MMTAARPPVRKDLDLLEYWQIVWKRRWIVAAGTAVCLAAAAVLSFTATPRFKATMSLLIEEQSSNKFNIQDILSSPTSASNFLGTYFNTQLKILQSRSLAERVVKKMNLAARPDAGIIASSGRSLFRSAWSILSFRWLRSGSPAGTAAAAPGPGLESRAVQLILEDLEVEPVPETQLVELSFASPSAPLAADVVNSLAQEYIAYTIETRSEATQQTSEFLTENIATLREDLAAKERDLQKYSDEKKIVELSDKESSVLSQFEDVQTAYSAAQITTVEAGSKYRELSKLRVDSLPQLVSNTLIQSLKTAYVQYKAEYEEKTRTTYRPDHVEMRSLAAKIDTAKAQLEAEIKKAVDAAQSEYSRALDNEVRLKQMVEEKRAAVTQTNSDSLLALALQSEVKQMRSILETMQARQAETQISARLSGLKSSNIKIVDPAVVPETAFSPNVKRNLIVALLLGLMFGVAGAFIAHALDNTLKCPEDLEKLTGLPSLGIIPHFSTNGAKGKGEGYGAAYGAALPASGDVPKITEIELVNHLFPKISIAEDYRTVRTSILFARADSEAKVIAFTSTQPQEGKSATVSNISISFAQLGEKVLTIDADLRKPRLHHIFKVRNTTGLSDYLAGRVLAEEAIQKTAVENFWLMPSGPHPPNPAELLNSRRMKELLDAARRRFSIVLIDLPPVLAVIDPLIVTALADMTVLVLKTGQTARKPLLRTIQELRKAKAQIVGAIFNDAKIRRNGFIAPYFQYEYYQDKTVAEAETGKSSEKRR